MTEASMIFWTLVAFAMMVIGMIYATLNDQTIASVFIAGAIVVARINSAVAAIMEEKK